MTKCTINSRDLLYGLRRVPPGTAAIDEKTSVEGFVELAMLDSGQLAVIGHYYGAMRVETVAGGHCEGSASILVQPKPLARILQLLGSRDVQLEVDKPSKSLTLKAPNARYVFQGYAPNDAKSFTLGPDTTTVTMPRAEFVALVKAALPFCSEDEFRPMITGVFLDVGPDHMRVVTTDGFKMFRTNRDAVIQGKPRQVILDSEVVRLAAAKMRGSEVTITLDGTFHWITDTATIVAGRDFAERYVGYKDVIPQLHTSFRINRGELIGVVQRLAAIADPHQPTAILTLDGGALRARHDGLALGLYGEESLTCSYDGAPVEFGMNATYLRECLTALPGADEVDVYINDPLKPIVIRAAGDVSDTGTLLLQMPVRINGVFK